SPHHYYLLTFLFSSHRPPLALHSFPTRRSSDLPPCSARIRKTIGRIARRSASSDGRNRATSASIPRRPVSKQSPALCLTSSRARSEEHTSELQSLRHLVCRLLLEKKKKQKHTC